MEKIPPFSSHNVTNKDDTFQLFPKRVSYDTTQEVTRLRESGCEETDMAENLLAVGRDGYSPPSLRCRLISQRMIVSEESDSDIDSYVAGKSSVSAKVRHGRKCRHSGHKRSKQGASYNAHRVYFC